MATTISDLRRCTIVSLKQMIDRRIRPMPTRKPDLIRGYLYLTALPHLNNCTLSFFELSGRDLGFKIRLNNEGVCLLFTPECQVPFPSIIRSDQQELVDIIYTDGSDSSEAIHGSVPVRVQPIPPIMMNALLAQADRNNASFGLQYRPGFNPPPQQFVPPPPQFVPPPPQFVPPPQLVFPLPPVNPWSQPPFQSPVQRSFQQPIQPQSFQQQFQSPVQQHQPPIPKVGIPSLQLRRAKDKAKDNDPEPIIESKPLIHDYEFPTRKVSENHRPILYRTRKHLEAMSTTEIVIAMSPCTEQRIDPNRNKGELITLYQELITYWYGEIPEFPEIVRMTYPPIQYGLTRIELERLSPEKRNEYCRALHLVQDRQFYPRRISDLGIDGYLREKSNRYPFLLSNVHSDRSEDFLDGVVRYPPNYFPPGYRFEIYPPNLPYVLPIANPYDSDLTALVPIPNFLDRSHRELMFMMKIYSSFSHYYQKHQLQFLYRVLVDIKQYYPDLINSETLYQVRLYSDKVWELIAHPEYWDEKPKSLIKLMDKYPYAVLDRKIGQMGPFLPPWEVSIPELIPRDSIQVPDSLPPEDSNIIGIPADRSYTGLRARWQNVHAREECVICYDNITPCLDCSHPVCSECLVQLPKMECPMCRRPIQGVAYNLITELFRGIVRYQLDRRYLEPNLPYLS